MSYNKVILLGNLTRDPEVRYTPKGAAVAQLGLALNETWTDDAGNKQERVTFVDVTVFGRQAEACGQYLAKGRQALIDGKLQLDQWDDKETGQKRTKLKVVAERVQFIGGSGKRDDAAPAQSSATPRHTPPPQPDAPAAGDDNIPF